KNTHEMIPGSRGGDVGRRGVPLCRTRPNNRGHTSAIPKHSVTIITGGGVSICDHGWVFPRKPERGEGYPRRDSKKTRKSKAGAVRHHDGLARISEITGLGDFARHKSRRCRAHEGPAVPASAAVHGRGAGNVSRVKSPIAHQVIGGAPARC